MYDTPLDLSERNLLKILSELLAAHGFVTRDVLSVATRGQGVEFGRSYARIKNLGLILEVESRPFLLRRLFGARTQILVQLTQAGYLVLSDGAQPLAPSSPEPVLVQAPDPVPTGVVPTAPAPSAPDVTRTAQAPKPAKRRPVTGFTEDLGGAPVQPEPIPPPADLEAIDALREVLSGLGIELTFAGEMLITHRMAQGDTGAEALLQVIVYTFAHAIQHDLSHGRQIAAMGLADYGVEVHREVQKLRDAGAVSAARFDVEMGQLAILTGLDDKAATLAASLLQDPNGGAAPPALLPEELRAGQSDEADDDDRF